MKLVKRISSFLQVAIKSAQGVQRPESQHEKIMNSVEGMMKWSGSASPASIIFGTPHQAFISSTSFIVIDAFFKLKKQYNCVFHDKLNI